MVTTLYKLYLQLLQSILDVWNYFSNSSTIFSSTVPANVLSMTKGDVAFIKPYYHIFVIRLLDSKEVFNVCFWQISSTLSKSKCRLILGKWSYTVLVEHALSNVYVHFFLAQPDIFDRSQRFFIPVKCRTNLQLFSTTIDFSLVALRFASISVASTAVVFIARLVDLIMHQ